MLVFDNFIFRNQEKLIGPQTLESNEATEYCLTAQSLLQALSTLKK